MATDSSGDSLMRKSALLVASFTAMALMLGGCASNLTGDSYSRDEARTVQTVRMGTIESLRPVKIEGTKTPIGGAAGAVVGGVGGSAIGGGRGSIVAAVIGAVAGGLLGSATEEGLTRTQGVEITVREDDGSMRAYVQQVQENEIFRVGERVRIMSVNGTSRVTH
ncbi:putative Outer membrane lipoprotein [Pseudomonas viridiflava]|nr:putative Outer membrane lipoprotein [Pseudomonas meliae]RMM66908.1 putative Outer membrane lipoprotein [Pseudomonas savastanoi pv. glycinea]RMQ10845.1 putative Outer membrane lipoprotein [Pseudomonas viridiflava]RMR58398.1 putative Outer membrane lipoprotein [Pseudomonas syringae pv. actinidiae]RMT09846.1 putative Outer membrane lipoprotein [Pseudomonas amygdali pv. lachrymans]